MRPKRLDPDAAARAGDELERAGAAPVLGDRADIVAMRVPLDASDPNADAARRADLSWWRCAIEQRCRVRRVLVAERRGRPLHPAERRRRRSRGSGWTTVSGERAVRSATCPPAPAPVGTSATATANRWRSIRRAGQVWVGFERANQIWRYAPGLVAPAADRGAAARWRGWTDNGGAESLVRLRDGRFLVDRRDRPRRERRRAQRADVRRRSGRAPRRGIRFGYRAARRLRPERCGRVARRPRAGAQSPARLAASRGARC